MRARIISVTAFALALCTSGMVAAQQTQQQQSSPNIPAGAERIVGKNVIGKNGQQVGSISDVLISQDGRVAGLVMNHGGALGVGGSNVIVPWEQMQIQGDQLSLQMTDQDVSNLPSID